MNIEKVRSVVQTYLEGYDKHYGASRYDAYDRVLSYHGSERPVAVQHALWMCQEMFLRSLLGPEEFSEKKAMRWLGFIQGVLWVTGLRSLEQLKRDSMPEGEQYKP